MISHAVIPAAGFGTRFLPATKAQPKEMLPILDKPTIQFVVEEAVSSGIRDILIITGRGKRAIEDHFDRSVELEEYLKKKGESELLERVQRISELANIHYVRQKVQKGLGDAVLCAADHVNDESFALLLGDTIVRSKVPCTKQLMDKYDRLKSSVIAVEEVEKQDLSKYGIVEGTKVDKDTYKIRSLVEKPTPEKAPSNLGIIGRYILTPDIFDFIRQTPEDAGGEIQLTDALNLLCRKRDCYASNFKGDRFDIGNQLDYAKAFIKFASENRKIGADLKAYMEKIT
ncbi:MAG: UTP--glucose-1-phosphate uridylyltransferase GalU [Candidatus Micrarchaeota archaeon]